MKTPPQKPSRRRHTRAWKRALDAVEKMTGDLRCRGLDLPRGRTNIALDALTWRTLHLIAARQRVTVGRLAASILRDKPADLSLSVALRRYVADYLIRAAGALRTTHRRRALR
jgi:predicted DNA-binding ribbon-helix-helix protein